MLNDVIVAVFVVFKCYTLTSSFFVEFSSNWHILIFNLLLCMGKQTIIFVLYFYQIWHSHVFHFRWIFFKLTHSSRNCFAWVNIPAFLVYIFYPIWPLKMTENRLTQNFRKTKNRTLIFVDLEPLMNNMMVFMSSAA